MLYDCLPFQSMEGQKSQKNFFENEIAQASNKTRKAWRFIGEIGGRDLGVEHSINWFYLFCFNLLIPSFIFVLDIDLKEETKETKTKPGVCFSLNERHSADSCFFCSTGERMHSNCIANKWREDTLKLYSE